MGIHGIHVARRASTIRHSFFAGGSLLFSIATSVEVDCIMATLKKYQEASGQMVYLEKYEAYFSRNLEEGKETTWDRTCVTIMMAHLRYLGLPTVFVRYKKDIFSQIIYRIWKKVKGWKEKFLSRAGKEVMIKSVAQVIPTYVMSWFRLPEDYGKELETMLVRLW